MKKINPEKKKNPDVIGVDSCVVILSHFVLKVHIKGLATCNHRKVPLLPLSFQVGIKCAVDIRCLSQASKHLGLGQHQQTKCPLVSASLS